MTFPHLGMKGINGNSPIMGKFIHICQVCAVLSEIFSVGCPGVAWQRTQKTPVLPGFCFVDNQ